MSAWLLTVKVILDKGRTVYEFPRDENLKQQWLIQIKCRNIQSIQHARMNHAYCIHLNPVWKKIMLFVNELGLPVLESSARVSKFYAPTDSEHKFNKREIKN